MTSGLVRARATAVAALLATLALLSAALPGPGGATTLLESDRVPGAANHVRVLVTGAVDDVAGAIADAGGRVAAHLPVLEVTVADVPPAAVAEIAGQPGVTVSGNEPVRLQVATSVDGDHPADDQGPRTLRADKLWRQGVDGSGIGIAVVDTGVSHVDELAGRVTGGVDLTVERNGLDGYGHGTPVASLAAGTTTGVAPGAHIVPVKIAGADGWTDVVRLLVGLDWIARHADVHDIRVVNLSLGSAPLATPLVDAAVQRLWDLGLVVVVAAGNDGPGSLGAPASNTHVVTVGATRGQDTPRVSDDVIAPWSATGLDGDGAAKPDVVAPGQSLVAAGAPGSWAYETHPGGHLAGGKQRVSGTSFSTGLVSGAVALLLDANPSWTNDQVLGQLVHTGQPTTGTAGRTPRVDVATRTARPVAANGDASGAEEDAVSELLALGPPDLTTLTMLLGDEDVAAQYGAGWYGAGWDAAGWYATDWFAAGWYGAGWYAAGWYAAGWYGAGWYAAGWYGAGWYGAGWT